MCGKMRTFARKACENGLRLSYWSKLHSVRLAPSLHHKIKSDAIMAKYLDPKADLTFKKIFGEHPDLVMSLLNALLPLEKGKEICDIHYLSPERVPRTEEGKDSIVDVCCETNDKRQFIVEMQIWLRFLTEINAYTEQVPQELLDNPEISKAIRLVEESAYTREQLLGYDMFWDRVRRDKDMANELRETKEQLQQVSVELKKAEQEKLDIARKLKAMNMMTTEQIAEATGLTAEEIEGL